MANVHAILKQKITYHHTPGAFTMEQLISWLDKVNTLPVELITYSGDRGIELNIAILQQIFASVDQYAYAIPGIQNMYFIDQLKEWISDVRPKDSTYLVLEEW